MIKPMGITDQLSRKADAPGKVTEANEGNEEEYRRARKAKAGN